MPRQSGRRGDKSSRNGGSGSGYHRGSRKYGTPNRGNGGGQAGHSQSRNEERRFFDALTKHEDSVIRSVDEAKRLMRAALAFAASDSAPALLYRLDENAGTSALRKCLEFFDASLFEEGLLPLLERLAQEDLNKPVYEIPMNSIILKLYNLNFLVPSIRSILPNWIAGGQNDKRTALAWFFGKLAVENAEARKDKDVIAIAKELEGAGCAGHLQTILEGNKVQVTLTEIRDTQMESAGGRHDNDKEDFRSIAIVPTCQEFVCAADPYLPLPAEDGSATEAFVLDRHFRLLREDLIGPSKEEKDDPKKQQRDIIYGVRPVAIETGAAIFSDDNKRRIVGETDPCIMFKMQLPKWFRIHSMKSKKQKEDYWDQNRRILPRDALVCLERRDEKQQWQPLRFGTIVRREKIDLVADEPSIGISFASIEDIQNTLMELSDRSMPPTRLVVVSADLFAYQPILRGLQMMTEVPFKHEIVNAERSLPAADAPIAIPDSMKDRVEKLDDGQHEALRVALNDRLALIQGPPGTGKSFIGTLLAEIFLASSDHTILVVTFTNHALDDFLESLLDQGVKKIVRMGGRSRSDRLSEYNLRELSRSGKAPFSREQTRRYAQLKKTIEEAEKDVKHHEKILSREIGEKCWNRVEPFLKTYHQNSWEQLHVPDDVIEDKDGFRTAGITGKDFLWKCWLKNKDPPAFLRKKVMGALWKLSPAERKAQKLIWQHQLYESEREEVALSLKTIKTARDELKGLQQITDATILSKARVIGCTTTKAAMCKSLLNGVGAGILLVEEAGEIRESDILTSLSQSTQRLVMIGDHKQLRPKCQHYPLTVESNRGFDLNRSLFERLAISSDFRLATLGVQHRMHPEISSIPKLLTYKDLADAPKVSSHPAPLGLDSRVIFANHHFSEDEQNVDALESVSKTNSHERAMILKTVQYMLKQGYSHDDIVVLTPYLGQMMKLQADLQKCVGVSLDERDLNEAREQFRGDDNFSEELAAAKKGSNSPSKPAIRVATIDNYQGEEAKIVLVSLVRSNDIGQIGFLKEPERVNVMLSRARECEIIFGNRATLEQAKGTLTPLKGGLLWKTIFSHLDARGCMFEGLPVLCQNHQSRAILSSPADFETYCRDGGCTRKCLRERDECDHPCQKNCHPGPCPKCPVMCPDVCSRGHPLSKRCSAEILPKCYRTITWTCPMGHHASGPCYKGRFGSECKTCEAMQVEEDACIRREEELNKELQDKHQRLADVKRKVEEVKQSHAHGKELAGIERELALAQEELNGFLAFESGTDDEFLNAADTTADMSDTLQRNVLTLLQKQHQVCLSNFSKSYRDEFGSVFDDDANKCMPLHSKKKRKLKDVLQCMPFCEFVPSKMKNQIDVRLCDAYNKSDLPRKVQKMTPVEIEMEEGENPESNDVTISDVHHEHTYDSVMLEPSNISQHHNQKSTSDSASSSILPPMTSVKHSSKDGETAVTAVLQRYIAEGALKADDLLDEISVMSPSIDALRFMIELELNPGGSTSSPPFKQTSDNTTNALLLTARAMDLSTKFPLQAREFAQQALVFVKDANVSKNYPPSWAAELETICMQSLNPKTKPSTIGKSHKTAREAWLDVMSNDPKAPEVMSDAILQMTGLEAVKEALLSMYHRFKLSQEQGDGAAASYSVRFEGNPGTGKTTIARHYGLFLQQLFVLPEGSLFQETNGAKLIQGGVKGLQDLLEDMKSKGGGVVFVDEAYQLADDREGKKVLDFILPLAESLETEYGSLVWVFAGYKKPLEKLFEHNEGLPSRFPYRFIFEDYSDEELQKIFCDMMEFKPPQPQRKFQRKERQEKKVTSTYQNSNYYSYPRGPPNAGQTTTCRNEMTWTYIQKSGWSDKYGNRTVDPKRVGTRSSELVDEKGNMWVHQDNIWKSDSGSSQQHYPGSPALIKSAKKNRRENPFHCDEQHLELAIKRLGRRRGERGFGNARAVRVLFEHTKDRQAIRITKERRMNSSVDIFRFSKADLLGPDVTADSLKKSKAWAELKNLEGLAPVKESVEQLFNLVLKNVEREKRGEELLDVSLNRLFLGNPGTGKTTVASIYGRILADLGLLSKGELILKCASDFVGEHLGSSEKMTNGILKSAEGCVLVIDEAYSLYTGGSTGGSTNDPYKTAVIDTIVEKVQAKPGADIAVVMIGYREEMENMLQNVNPGLSRRFQIENAFNFPDFNDEALVRIMMASAKKRGVKLSLKVAKRAVRTLAKSRAKPNFGNAGAVDNLLSKGILLMQRRDHQNDELTAEDFDYSGDGVDAAALDSLFDDLIGCESVKEQMAELKSTVEFSQAQGKTAVSCGVSHCYLFLGNPGTGKTTCARKMGRMFNELGLLPGDELVEAKASDLITGYVGQAGKCTRDILRKSLGGVLFIDEAYQMDPSRGGSYMTEAVDELVGALTEEEFKGKLLVILAGYNEDMEKMMNTNPGLKSRFSERVHFDDFNAKAVADLLFVELKRAGVPLDTRDSDPLVEFSQRLIDESGSSFGNGRDCVTWGKYVYKVVAKRFSQQSKTPGAMVSLNSTLDDIKRGLEQLLDSRRPRVGGQSCATEGGQRTSLEATAQNQDLPPINPVHSTKMAEIEHEVDIEPEDVAEEKGVVVPTNIFEGMDPAFLNTLQKAIDAMGLGSEDGANRLRDLSPDSQEFADLICLLKRDADLNYDDAKAKLIEWQSNQENLEAMIKREKQKTKTLGARPIWRCGVCGRADKPWIACYVAPFIVGYEKVELGGS